MKLILSIITIVVVFVSQAINAQTQNITATVVNVSSDEGKVGFALYDKNSFMKKPIAAERATITNGKSTVTFENLPSGAYAVVCYHDENSNNQMDFEPSGIPLEDYGASNNVANFGPPTYEDAKFLLKDKDLTVTIRF